MSHETLETRVAVFRHAIYSPKGGIEGLLAELDGRPVQFSFKHEPRLEEIVALALDGDELDVEIAPAAAGDKGEPAHPVYHLRNAERHAGAEEAADGDDEVATRGRVVRLNYALHGEPNGVVLDNGDFVHLRPDGMRQLALAVGDPVEATGTARRLRFGEGRAIEADSVNGVAMTRGPKPKPEKKLPPRAGRKAT